MHSTQGIRDGVSPCGRHRLSVHTPLGQSATVVQYDAQTIKGSMPSVTDAQNQPRLAPTIARVAQLQHAHVPAGLQEHALAGLVIVEAARGWIARRLTDGRRAHE